MAERLQFVIDLPSLDGRDFYSKKVIEEALIESQSKLQPYFHRLLDNGDSRLEIQCDSLIIEDLNYDNCEGIATVTYGWSYYMGCKDMNDDGEADASFEFQFGDCTLSIDIELPPAWRPDDYMG